MKQNTYESKDIILLLKPEMDTRQIKRNSMQEIFRASLAMQQGIATVNVRIVVGISYYRRSLDNLKLGEKCFYCIVVYRYWPRDINFKNQFPSLGWYTMEFSMMQLLFTCETFILWPCELFFFFSCLLP